MHAVVIHDCATCDALRRAKLTPQHPYVDLTYFADAEGEAQSFVASPSMPSAYGAEMTHPFFGQRWRDTIADARVEPTRAVRPNRWKDDSAR